MATIKIKFTHTSFAHLIYYYDEIVIIMSKSKILLMFVIGLLGCYGFSQTSFFSRQADESITEANDETTISNQEIIKDKNLHSAFSKILNSNNKSNRSPGSINKENAENNDINLKKSNESQVTDDYEDKFIKLSIEEKKQEISNLINDISNDETVIFSLKNTGNDEDTVSKLEERSEEKRIKLENMNELLKKEQDETIENEKQ